MTTTIKSYQRQHRPLQAAYGPYDRLKDGVYDACDEEQLRHLPTASKWEQFAAALSKNLAVFEQIASYVTGRNIRTDLAVFVAWKRSR